MNTITNIQANKIQLTKWILDTDNPQILEAVKNIFTKEQNPDFWTTLTGEQKADIETGISEVTKGESIEYESVMNKYRQ
jgi:hypothetical protein